MKFQTGSKSDDALNAWLQTHVLECSWWQISDDGKLPKGLQGGAITYTFTPTHAGLIIKVKCGCGIEADVTDYDEWQNEN